jgi:DNA-binding response OmpR family regulator
MKILLAEDDVNLGEQIVYKLQKQEGYEIEWVLDGEEAYHNAIHSSYDVVILDWMMPNGNGEEICRHLRKQGYCGGILLLTGTEGDENRTEWFESGIDDYLVKPFEFDEFLALLQVFSAKGSLA